MGLYRASNISRNVTSSRKGARQDITDPNAAKNLARAGRTPEPVEEESQPRKRLVEMTLDEQTDAAKDKILDIVSRTPRTTSELTDKLLTKGFKEQAVERAIARLIEVGVLNDEQFAEQWAYSRFHFSGRSTYVIAQELRRKGLPEDLVEKSLEQLEDPALQQEKAMELALTKARSLAKSKAHLDASDAKKIAQMLARRGFSAGLCFETAKQAINNMGNTDIHSDGIDEL